MRVGFIGAGKVGFTLGKYFREHGVQVTGYYSRSTDSAKEAANFIGTQYFDTIEKILSQSDILFLTVPDTIIEIIWKDIKTVTIHNKIICHCSGILSSEVFDGIEHCHAFGYSIHPLFAIHSKLISYKEISQALFTIEGNEKHMNMLSQFIEQLGNPVHIITAHQKIKYHTAATFLSNHVTALAHVGCKLLRECGFEDKFAETALKTLFLNQCKAVAENGSVQALTGPVERNDLSTVQKHIESFEENENERKLYSLLSEQLIEIAKEKHIDYDYSKMELFIKKEIEGTIH